MPVRKCSNGKYRIGSGPCIYTTREKAEEAQAAIHAEDQEKTLPFPSGPYRPVFKGLILGPEVAPSEDDAV